MQQRLPKSALGRDPNFRYRYADPLSSARIGLSRQVGLPSQRPCCHYFAALWQNIALEWAVDCGWCVGYLICILVYQQSLLPCDVATIEWQSLSTGKVWCLGFRYVSSRMSLDHEEVCNDH
jgi:hypothetical protein